MGDRAQVYIDHEDAYGYLYTHSGGYALLGDVAKGLENTPNWDDIKVMEELILQEMQKHSSTARRDERNMMAGDIRFLVQIFPNTREISIRDSNEYIYSFEEFIGYYA